MPNEINERIDVLASFDLHGLRPRLFVWGKRRYPVTRITATWTQPQGLFRRFFFAVQTDRADIYEISFCTRNLTWHLLRVHQP